MSAHYFDYRQNFQSAVGALMCGVALLGLVACAPTAVDPCRDFLDAGLWDDAISTCPTDTDEGKALSAQAHMGRANVSLLDLLEGLSRSLLTGEALILDLFELTVGSAEFTDVESAVALFLSSGLLQFPKSQLQV